MASDNPGAPLPAAILFAPMMGIFGAMADWADASLRCFEQPSSGRPGSHQSNPVAADLLLPMGQAMMIAGNRSLSYWLGLVQIIESHQMTLVQAMSVDAIDGRMGRSERLAVTDRLRGLLREVGDLAAREARILQSEFSALDENLAQSLQQREQSSSYHRRWRAKV